jgi:hypothetical protein
MRLALVFGGSAPDRGDKDCYRREFGREVPNAMVGATVRGKGRSGWSDEGDCRVMYNHPKPGRLHAAIQDEIVRPELQP